MYNDVKVTAKGFIYRKYSAIRGGYMRPNELKGFDKSESVEFLLMNKEGQYGNEFIFQPVGYYLKIVV